jgi:hypothetical protein
VLPKCLKAMDLVRAITAAALAEQRDMKDDEGDQRGYN